VELACPVCGESWDFDSLHDEAQARYGIPYHLDRETHGNGVLNPAYDSDAYQAVYKIVSGEFRTKGCKALATAFDGACSGPDPDEERGRNGLTRSQTAAALYEILGDDMDGAAAMLEDEGF
jgi:hypothetical protein